jgi:hypothetical protein
MKNVDFHVVEGEEYQHQGRMSEKDDAKGQAQQTHDFSVLAFNNFFGYSSWEFS